MAEVCWISLFIVYWLQTLKELWRAAWEGACAHTCVLKYEWVMIYSESRKNALKEQISLTSNVYLFEHTQNE